MGQSHTVFKFTLSTLCYKSQNYVSMYSEGKIVFINKMKNAWFFIIQFILDLSAFSVQ